MKAEKDAAPIQAKPDYALVVIHPFGDYQRGQKVTDADEIDSINASDNRHHCNKVAA